MFEESDRSVEYHCYPTNPNGEFQPLPDVGRGRWHLLTYAFDPAELSLDRLSETPWCVQYKYSSKFIRDREYPPIAPAGVLRIAGIGDSFALGEGVPLEKTLFRRIGRMLGEGYEVINGGQSGVDTAEELQVLQKLAAGAHCTRAIFVFVPNDVALTPELQNRQRYINDLINIRDQYLAKYESRAWYAGHSRLLHFIGAHFAMEQIKRETIQWYLNSYNPAYNARNLHRWQMDVRSLAEMPQCRVAFVLYPLLEGFETGYPLAPIHKVAAATAESAGLPVLDLAPVFKGRRTNSL